MFRQEWLKPGSILVIAVISYVSIYGINKALDALGHPQLKA